VKKKLCMSLTERSARKCIETVASCKADLIEHRIDFMGRIRALDEIYMAAEKPVIAACRSFRNGGLHNGTETQRVDLLLEAISSGASYVDIDAETRPAFLDLLRRHAGRTGCKIIISKHYHENTPSSSTLEQLVSDMQNKEADILKVVTTPESIPDCLRVLHLYSHEVRIERPLVAFAMAQLGMFTRVAALFLGAPFMYVAQDDGNAAAPGQIPLSKMREILEVLQ
jgi:3-dehydroquinate dehydratase/shikimate dehydrogenase